MKKDDYTDLESHIIAALEQHPESASYYRIKGLSPQRYRWDLLHNRTKFGLNIKALYDKGLNDNHIDTALRKIMAEHCNEWAAQKAD